MTSTLENYLKELLDCVKAVIEHLDSKSDWNNQNFSLYKQGLFRKRDSGIVIPLESIKHRLQVECHEQMVLTGYMQLAEGVLQRHEEPMSLFSLRTLMEIGFDKVNILFGEGVTSEERQEFKLIDSLSDLLGFTDEEYALNFLALLAEERANIRPDILKHFESAERLLQSQEQISLSVLKNVRRVISSRVGQLSSKVSLPHTLQGKTDLEPLMITFSHLLHGNPISIKVVMEPKFFSRHVNWIDAVIWNTSLNILILTSVSITDEALLKRISAAIAKAEWGWKEMQRRRLPPSR